MSLYKVESKRATSINKLPPIKLTNTVFNFRYDNQTSEEIFLVAGKYYYLEAIQKGVDNSDSLSVGVRLPTGRYQRPINKENLQWRLPGTFLHLLIYCFSFYFGSIVGLICKKCQKHS